MGEPIVSIQDLSFSYRSIPVLEKVNLAIKEREFVTIIGPNGGGKTTLLKLMAGLLRPTTGRITVCGEDPAKLREDISYVPQSMAFDRQFPITVMELVLQGRLSAAPVFGRFREEDREAARRSIETVDLLDCAQMAIGELSGGQVQRALIARALASDPKLLLLDEPTSSVDPSSKVAIYDLIEQLTQEMTVVMVTHDLQALIENVQKVICVNREVSRFTPEQVCKHFAVGLYHTPLKEEES